MPRTQTFFKGLLFLLTLCIVILYCFLPTTLNNYTWIPGNDYREYLQHLETFPSPIRYYGALPTKFLPFDDYTSLRIYYYSTPLLIFLGLFCFLKRYGLETVILAFVVLFFISSVILQDMEAGSFIGILGFYCLFLPSLYFLCKYKLPKQVVSILLLASVIFHTAIGVFLITSYIIARVRSLRDIIPLLIPCFVVTVLVLLFGGSLVQSAQLLHGPSDIYAPPITFIYFTKKFLGVSVIALLGLMFLFCYNTSKLRMFNDRFVITLLALALILLAFAFSPYFPIISYRLALFAVGSLLVAFIVAFAKAYVSVTTLNPKEHKYIDLGITLVISVLLYNTFSDLMKYWLSMGI